MTLKDAKDENKKKIYKIQKLNDPLRLISLNRIISINKLEDIILTTMMKMSILLTHKKIQKEKAHIRKRLRFCMIEKMKQNSRISIIGNPQTTSSQYINRDKNNIIEEINIIDIRNPQMIFFELMK